MLRIDDQAYMKSLDSGGMLHFLGQVPEVGEAAYERGRVARIPLASPGAILICGMGCAVVSGDMIRTRMLDVCSLPVVVHRGDRLPKFAGEDTLCIFMSHPDSSGEALGCLQDAIARGVPTVVLTSGGSAGELGREHGCAVVELPPSWQPRAALGDLFFVLLGVLDQVSTCSPTDVKGAVTRLRELRETFAPEVPTDRNPAKSLAFAIHGKAPVIVGATPNTESVALRWKCQFNENAKQTTLFTVLPEMTHNDIVNLSARPHHEYVVLLYTDPEDSDYLRRKRGHTMNVIAPYVAEVLEVKGEGETLLERQMAAIYLGDWVSVYLGFMNGVDPTPVDAIGQLEGRINNTEAHA